MRSILSFSIVSIILFVVSCTRDAEVIVKNTGDNPDMVAYYQLRGYHIRAGEALINDLKRLYGANGAMAIPLEHRNQQEHQGLYLEPGYLRPAESATYAAAHCERRICRRPLQLRDGALRHVLRQVEFRQDESRQERPRPECNVQYALRAINICDIPPSF